MPKSQPQDGEDIRREPTQRAEGPPHERTRVERSGAHSIGGRSVSHGLSDSEAVEIAESARRSNGARREESTRIAPEPTGPEEGPADEDATQAGPPISVQVLEGPDVGVRRAVRGGRMIVGRGEGCDLRLSDASTSRRHLEIAVSFSGTTLRDLGSGNGTLVNGKRVTESPLLHKDRIGLGHTVLVVIDDLKRLEEEAAEAKAAKEAASKPKPPEPDELSEISEPSSPGALKGKAKGKGKEKPAPAASQAKGLLGFYQSLPAAERPKYLIGALVGVALLFLMLLLMIGPRTPGETEGLKDLKVMVERAEGLMRERRWPEARGAIEAAQALYPGAVELTQLIDRCAFEAKNQELLEKCKRLATAGKHDEALKTAEELDVKSAAFAEARELVPGWKAAQKKHLIERIKHFIENGEVEKAEELMFNRDDLELIRFINNEKEKAAKKGAKGAKGTGAKPVEKPVVPVRVQPKLDEALSPRTEIERALASVVRKLEAGTYDAATAELSELEAGAASTLLQNKARVLKGIVPQFGREYEDGMAKFRGGKYEQAAPPLLNALAHWRDMNLSSKLEARLKADTLKAWQFTGRAALKRGEYGQAAIAFREVLKLDERSDEASTSLRKIADQAYTVYLEAYAQMRRSPEVARRRFKEVLEMVPPSHDVYKLTQQRLEEMEKE